MSKAKLILNSNHIHKGGWGFLLLDQEGNSYSFHYSNGYLEIPDAIAKQFESREDLDITYSDGTKSDRINQESKPIKSEPKQKRHTKTEIFRMNKSEQVALIRSLGSAIIPRLERNKIKLIMELESK